MIIDHIQNLGRYALPQKERIIEFLNAQDPLAIPDGEHAIDGRHLFVRVMSDHLKPAEENKFETHRLYADLQYVAQGVELMQTAPADRLTPLTGYDATGDYQFFTADGLVSDLVIRAGAFAVFYPGEPHRPGCRSQETTDKIKKLVFKIKV